VTPHQEFRIPILDALDEDQLKSGWWVGTIRGEAT
jgi:hypothetical protein